jgi:hypothetical protein
MLTWDVWNLSLSLSKWYIHLLFLDITLAEIGPHIWGRYCWLNVWSYYMLSLLSMRLNRQFLAKLFREISWMTFWISISLSIYFLTIAYITSCWYRLHLDKWKALTRGCSIMSLCDRIFIFRLYRVFEFFLGRN